MPPISLMIKPSSSNCNLRCKYCFYHDLASCREMPSHGIMSVDLLENTLTKAFDFAKGNMVMISFQGGEPLLAGKDFFRSFSAMLPRLNKYKSPIFLAIQTNGTLIDEEWCDIFRQNNFLLGLSLDGTDLTNALRIDANGEETFDRVYAVSKLLQRKKVEFNILTVVTKPVVENIDKVYAFFRNNKFKYLQFIPCLKPLNGEENFPDNFYINGKDYGVFLKRLFTYYLQDYKEGNYTSIRLFDNFVRLAHGERAEQCGMNGHCTHQYVIEGDGEVYPCDFYCTDDYSLGNIKNTDFFRLEKHPIALSFIMESITLPEKCKECAFLPLCKNGCKRERISLDKCEAYKEFFPSALPHLKNMY